jgi:hypothetical protein
MSSHTAMTRSRSVPSKSGVPLLWNASLCASQTAAESRKIIGIALRALSRTSRFLCVLNPARARARSYRTSSLRASFRFCSRRLASTQRANIAAEIGPRISAMIVSTSRISTSASLRFRPVNWCNDTALSSTDQPASCSMSIHLSGNSGTSLKARGLSEGILSMHLLGSGDAPHFDPWDASWPEPIRCMLSNTMTRGT